MKRWLISLAIAIAFVACLWPTPYLDSRGGAGISIGAFWVFVAGDQGLPATASAVGWMFIGLVVGAGIGYLLLRRRGAKSTRWLVVAIAVVAGYAAATWTFNTLAHVWRPGQALGLWRFLILLFLAFGVFQLPLWVALRLTQPADDLE
jgi:uncharacterized membrane protein AbrB (regulator of aidB expression)